MNSASTVSKNLQRGIRPLSVDPQTNVGMQLCLWCYNPGQNSWATYVQTGPKTTPTPPVNVGRTNHSARCAVGNNIAEGRGDEGGPTNFGRDCRTELELAVGLGLLLY